MKLTKKIGVIGLGVGLAAITSAIYLSTAIAGKGNALKPCVETLKAAHKNTAIVQISNARDNDTQTDYVVYAVGAMDRPEYWEPLVAVNSGVCRILNADREDSDKPISNFVPPPIAEKLTSMILIRKIATLGGTKAFEDSLAKAAKESKKPLLMPTENYNSLKKLGVKIPANIKAFDGVPKPAQLEEDRH